MRIRILLNQTRDGRCDGYQHGQDMAEVYTYDETSAPDTSAALDRAHFLFNVGDDPDFGLPDPIALTYRKLRNRSLSIGDVVACDDVCYAVSAEGWRRVEQPVTVPANTLLTYAYYDASLCGWRGHVVLAGRLDEEDQRAVSAAGITAPGFSYGADTPRGFVPAQVGIPDLRDQHHLDRDGDAFYPVHNLTGFEPTDTLPSDPPMTVGEFVRLFTTTTWDTEATR